MLNARTYVLSAIVAVLALGASKANAAYKVLSVPGTPRSIGAPAHILVSGAGAELVDGFFRAAVSRAYALHAQNPDRAVAILLPIEGFDNLDSAQAQKLIARGVKEGDREAQWVADSGLQLVTENPATLSGAELVRFVSQFKRIQSLEIFSHSSWVAGGAIAGGRFENRFPFSQPLGSAYAPGMRVDASMFTPGFANLRNSMADDAFVVFWGCNSAFTMAPMTSALLQVPAYGSLTFTDFELLHKDGNYYKEEGTFPVGGSFGASPWATRDSAYASPFGCDKGCRRMKPNNVPYNGVWGDYDDATVGFKRYNGGGLGFMKAFCNYSDSIRRPTGSCLRGMGAFMMGSISTIDHTDRSFAAYKYRALDYLCSRDNGQDAFLECARALEDSEFTGNRVYSAFRGNALECQMEGCPVKFVYQAGGSYGIDQRSVRLDAPVTVMPTTVIREYQNYLNGYTAYTGLAHPTARLIPVAGAMPPTPMKPVAPTPEDPVLAPGPVAPPEPVTPPTSEPTPAPLPVPPVVPAPRPAPPSVPQPPPVVPGPAPVVVRPPRPPVPPPPPMGSTPSPRPRPRPSVASEVPCTPDQTVPPGMPPGTRMVPSSTTDPCAPWIPVWDPPPSLPAQLLKDIFGSRTNTGATSRKPASNPRRIDDLPIPSADKKLKARKL